MSKINLPNPILLVISLLILSCSSSDDQRPSCYQDENRKVVSKLTNRTGVIVAPSEDGCSVYVIKENSGDFTLDFGPCNLPDDFKEDGLEVSFSGFVFDTSDLNICAELFEIINIKRKQ